MYTVKVRQRRNMYNGSETAPWNLSNVARRQGTQRNAKEPQKVPSPSGSMQYRAAPLVCVLVLLLVASVEVAGQSKKLENLYTILEVEPGASTSEIRTAYHKASLKWHPDKNQGSKDAEKMFIKVQEAYEVLKDPNRRAAFDAAWKYQQRSRGSSGGGRSHGGTESGQARGPDGSSDESFSFRWEGKDVNFDELMEMMRKWEQQSSTLRTAKMAFTSFVTDLSDHKMQYYLDQYLPIHSNDSFKNNMVKRVLRWIAWSGRGLLRRFLQNLEGGENSQGGGYGGSRGGFTSQNGPGGRGRFGKNGRGDL